ncbi:MAG: hypothetical protein O2907_10120 [Proteobacteria bacterium]|nr:hypothetical protein [Pseudomonadota bacterium]MDA1064661.1 hypothetical protein [Pseudomonadota bacterium]
MKLTTKIAISCLLSITAPMAFACDYPERPSIPDGNTASKDELLAAKEAVNAYLAGVDVYLTCIEKAAVAELDSPTPDDLQRRDEMLTKKFDAANDAKEMVGEEFNQQVRAYNAARQPAN